MVVPLVVAEQVEDGDMKRKNPYQYYLIIWIVFVAMSFIGINFFFSFNPLIILLLGLNLSSFFLFGIDKWQSGRKGMRIPEKVLYFVTLCCGSAGTLLGMHFFRHKTRKTSFQLIVALLILIQIGFLLTFYQSNSFL